MTNEHDAHSDRVIDPGNWRAHIKYEGSANIYAADLDVRDALGGMHGARAEDQTYEVSVFDAPDSVAQDIYYVRSYEFKAVQQFAVKVSGDRSYLIQTVSRPLTGDP